MTPSVQAPSPPRRMAGKTKDLHHAKTSPAMKAFLMLKSAASVLTSFALAVLLVHALAGAAWALDFTSASYPSNENWMKDLPDDALITQLSLPGTHDSATDHGHCKENGWIVPVIEMVSCQTYPISDQLKMGIRFFDIRLAYENGTLRFHHGPYYLEQVFSDALDAAQSFLNQHPSEFVIFLIKQEHTSASADDFWQRINDRISTYPSGLFFLEKGVPSVAKVRGKIVVMGRDKSSHPQGWHVSWPDNTTYYQGRDHSSKHGDLLYIVEDHYSLASVSTKTKYREIRQNIALARICFGSGDPNTLFISFMSGEGDKSLRPPSHFADYGNQHINDWLKDNYAGGYRLGVVMMDYAGDSNHHGDKILETVINHNKFFNNN
jgi:1-phosphatidylinositol phosphodiesterase